MYQIPVGEGEAYCTFINILRAYDVHDTHIISNENIRVDSHALNDYPPRVDECTAILLVKRCCGVIFSPRLLVSTNINMNTFKLLQRPRA